MLKIKRCSTILSALFISACSQQNMIATEINPITTPNKPNIIYILADDMGYSDLGIYGQKRIKTPNIDQMAREGAMFTNFYAGANVCGPSRATLMTGKHQGHARIRGNKQEYPLQPQDITVAEMLKEAGYRTGVVGKWGLGDEGSTGTPDKQGFDFFYGYLNHVHAHNHFPAWLWRNGKKEMLNNKVVEVETKYSYFPAGIALPEHRNEYAGDLIIKESIGFIERNANKKEPFFLYVAPIIPHANGDVTLVNFTDDGLEVPDHGQYEKEQWPHQEKGFAAMITHLDNGVGQILERLETLGIDDNTVVIFSSDNGPHKEGGHKPDYFDSNGDFRGIKRDLWEGGIRSPMIVWGPKLIKQQVSQHIGYAGDFFATAADLAGVTIDNTQVDSVSYLPTLIGQTEQQQESDYLYWEDYFARGGQAARKGKWKAVREPIFTGKIKLYDISADIEETHDLASENPKLVREFEAIFQKAHTPDPDWQPRVKKINKLIG